MPLDWTEKRTAQAGSDFGSLTTRLNVPVVRGSLGFESERSHKIGHYWILFGDENGGAIPPFERGDGSLLDNPSADKQVSNESLILAQNQRWRRA